MSPNIVDPEGRTPLLIAIYGKSVPIVQYLVKEQTLERIDLNGVDYQFHSVLYQSFAGMEASTYPGATRGHEILQCILYHWQPPIEKIMPWLHHCQRYEGTEQLSDALDIAVSNVLGLKITQRYKTGILDKYVGHLRRYSGVAMDVKGESIKLEEAHAEDLLPIRIRALMAYFVETSCRSGPSILLDNILSEIKLTVTMYSELHQL